MRTIIKFVTICVFIVLKFATKKARYGYMINYLTKGEDQFPTKELECLTAEHFIKCYDEYVERFRPVHSTIYDNAGFYGRPELFYMVGGFEFDIESDKDNIMISAKDVYDWHHMKDSEGIPFYFASPLPFNLSWNKHEDLCFDINTFLGAIILQEGFDGSVAISNYFWEWLGGKEFTTHMYWTFTRKAWSDAWNTEE